MEVTTIGSGDAAQRARFEAEALVHLDALYSFALKLARVGDDAEDLVSDTVLRAFERWDQYRLGTNIRAWLFTILYHVFVSRKRRIDAREVPEGDGESGWSVQDLVGEADPEGRFYDSFLDDEIVRAIDAELPLESADANYSGEVAERWRYRDGGGEIGVIASVTQAFCRDCTRARLATDARVHGIDLPGGRIFLLTHLRYLGYCFNPVSFFYLFDRAGALRLVMAEVNNTFGERHSYLIEVPGDGRRDGPIVQRCGALQRMAGGALHGLLRAGPGGQMLAQPVDQRVTRETPARGQAVDGLPQRGAVERLTYEGNWNVSPHATPDGKSFVFMRRDGGRFQIAIQDIATRQMQVLTSGPLDESPSVSPNSKMILYAAEQGGRGILAAVSSDGRVKQRLVAPATDVREPAWGPLPR